MLSLACPKNQKLMSAKQIKPSIVQNFKRFLAVGGYCTPPGRAACALRSARTLEEWRKAESAGLVRLLASPEQESYESVFGKESFEQDRECIERHGCWWVTSEVNHGTEATGDDWQHADSIGMCVYANPLDPFENSYVIDLMQAALDQIDQPGCVDELCTSLEN